MFGLHESTIQATIITADYYFSVEDTIPLALRSLLTMAILYMQAKFHQREAIEVDAYH